MFIERKRVNQNHMSKFIAGELTHMLQETERNKKSSTSSSSLIVDVENIWDVLEIVRIPWHRFVKEKNNRNISKGAK